MALAGAIVSGLPDQSRGFSIIHICKIAKDNNNNIASHLFFSLFFLFTPCNPVEWRYHALYLYIYRQHVCVQLEEYI